jgi:phage gpG-like protein
MVATTSKSAVLGKLGLMGGVTSGMAPQLEIKFEPTLVIAAGRIERMGMEFKRGFREPLEEAITKVMMISIWNNFNLSGRPKWAPLSEATLRIREWYGNGNTWPLIWTGALQETASSFGVWTITNGYATISDLPSDVWYGKIHQAGYGGKSMKTRLKAAGGDAKAALDGLMDEQVSKMQSGGTMGGGGASPIPARPFIMFQPEDEDEITDIFIKWVDEKMDEHWHGRGIG